MSETSSANNFGSHLRSSCKSLMNIRKRSGPNTEPWGTTDRIGVQLHISPLRTTRGSFSLSGGAGKILDL